ncbi:MAG: hypothetical protein PF483_14795, partial [Halothiobacillus sp.]|nr:hypothetical protein [Halothiobacillus sp.]
IFIDEDVTCQAGEGNISAVSVYLCVLPEHHGDMSDVCVFHVLMKVVALLHFRILPDHLVKIEKHVPAEHYVATIVANEIYPSFPLCDLVAH